MTLTKKKTPAKKPTQKQKTPDALALLEADHGQARAALRTLAESTERALEKRTKIRAKVALALWTHMNIEETIFYPAYAKAGKTTDDDVRGMEARTEHDCAKSALMRLEASDPGSTEFRAMAKVVFDLIDHHTGEEEDEMFPRARKLLGKERLMELGVEMKARKDELMASGATPSRPEDEPREIAFDVAS